MSNSVCAAAVRATLILGLVVALLLVLATGCVSIDEAASSTPGPRLQLGQDVDRPSDVADAQVPHRLLKGRSLVAAVDPNERFDAQRAFADAVAITEFGVRPGGSRQERLAAEYVAGRLREMGYEPLIQTFALPNGKTSRNVIATLPGYASERTVIIGAHFDTKPPSPGANDNASGCGLVLELARLLEANPAAPRVEFVFFGNEEYLLDAPGDNHHLGSRDHAAKMTEKQVADTAAMISVDMVGYGKKFHVRTMQKGPQTLAEDLLGTASGEGVRLTYLKDLGKTGWSDHEPYELLGIPAVWLQWLTDPEYHKPGDDADHLKIEPMEVTGEFLLGWIRGLDEQDLERLCER